MAKPATIRLKGEIGSRIKRLAEHTGRSQSFYISQMFEREIERECSILHDMERHRARQLEPVSRDESTTDLDLDD